jgi:Cu-Zn family superoxide dismutase
MRPAVLCTVLCAVLLMACRSVQSGSSSNDGVATAAMRNGASESVGDLRLQPSPEGVRLTGELFNLPPGVHGIHFHAAGKCDTPGFESSGPHFNPAGRKHGLENPDGPHAGDLPTVTVSDSGRASVALVTPRVTLDSAGATSVLDADGTAIIIHAAPDDQRTDPSGNSGARIACGVVRRG